ncbi:MAG: hypothetical protein HYT29_02215 [Parcubacteria group bacterium]|nr:hypothetical protein [Parcubacteria group bacterium]
MPLPTPKKGEQKDDFISRCIRSAVIQREYSSQKQQLAVCFSRLRAKRGANASPKKGKKISR